MYDLCIFQNILGICKVNGNFEFFGTNTIMGICIDRQ